MLQDNLTVNYAGAAQLEVYQCLDEGRKAADYMDEAKAIDALPVGSPERIGKLNAFLDRMAALPLPENNDEPSDLAGIQAARPEGKPLPMATESDLFNKVHGAWLGRIAGCLLGKPIEGMKRDRIIRLAKGTDNYPFHHYISSDAPPEVLAETGLLELHGGWDLIDKLDHAPSDDDTNYTVLSLKLLTTYGQDFSPDDVAEAWLANLPILDLYTAEQAAYQNLINKHYPPESATFRNPYREWIGAQIRTDFYGYINPGNPQRAAAMAFRDASISHIRNGIYGAMWISAMNAAAFVLNDAEAIIEQGLMQIPKNSRLTRDIRRVLDWYHQGLSFEAAIDAIFRQYPEDNPHNPVHTLSNAMIVAMGLLYGEMDFEKTIGIAVVAGYDTDCNGATSGSIIGIAKGAAALPAHFVDPLNDILETAVRGYNLVSIKELAQKTLELMVPAKA